SMLFINEIDNMGSDCLSASNTLNARLEANAHHVQYAIGAEDDFEGIIDVVTMQAHFYTDDLGTKSESKEIPEEYKANSAELRNSLIEAIADYDEDIMMKFLEGEEVENDEL